MQIVDQRGEVEKENREGRGVSKQGVMFIHTVERPGENFSEVHIVMGIDVQIRVIHLSTPPITTTTKYIYYI